MVLYREKKRRSPWLWVAAIGVFLALLAIIFVVVSIATRPSYSERLTSAINLMEAQLDVLVVSHYTEATVSEGEASPEFGAAVDDIARVAREWSSVEEVVAPGTASEVSQLIAELNRSILDLSPASDVALLVAELVEYLDSTVQSS